MLHLLAILSISSNDKLNSQVVNHGNESVISNQYVAMINTIKLIEPDMIGVLPEKYWCKTAKKNCKLPNFQSLTQKC